MFYKILSYDCLENALAYSKINMCTYVENLNLNQKDGEIDSCSNCDIEDCFFVKNRNNKNIFKEIYVQDVEDVKFPCIAYQNMEYCEKEILTFISIEDAKNNTKYGTGNKCWY